MNRKTIFAAFIAVVLSTSSTVFAQASYPSELPANFQNAPEKILCERDNPTSVILRVFANSDEKWMLIIGGRNKKETYITLMRFSDGGINALAFVMTPQGWKNASTFTKEEAKKLKKEDFIFNQEEQQFIQQCANQQTKESEETK